MGQPVHKFLEEFPADGTRAEAPVVQQLRPRLVAQPPEPSTMVGRIADAYAKGYEEGQARTKAEAHAELDAVHCFYRRELDELTGRLSDKLADELTSQLRGQLSRMQNAIADQAASALVPVLQHALTEASVRELADGLSDLTRDGGAFAIELRGPKDLLDRVWSRYLEKMELLGSDGPQVRFAIEDMAEVRVVVNDAVIESRLMEWVARIAEAAG